MRPIVSFLVYKYSCMITEYVLKWEEAKSSNKFF